MSFAVVPIKRLSKGKSRLASHLERDQLERLCLAMLNDIVAALEATPSIDRVAVVTPDPEVAAAAEEAGAIALLRDDPGLNASIDGAIEELSKADESALTILGDVAGALPEDLERLYDAVREHDAAAALAPARDGGTAALLRKPARVIASRFGPQSADAHRDDAQARGVLCVDVPLPSLEIDLDRPQDIDDFLARAAGGPETRRVLAALGWNDTPEKRS